MEQCKMCGSTDFIKFHGKKVCQYCRSAVAPVAIATNIDIEDDVTRLLRKCELEPWNARRYANLVLDIDPCNAEAMRYL